MGNTQNDVEWLLGKHFPVRQGKVRNSYRIGSDKTLFYVTGRRSIFDMVLGVVVPGLAEYLNAQNISSRLMLRRELDGFNDDLLAYGAGIDEYLPTPLRKNPAIQRCAIVAKNAHMIDRELVVRYVLTGGGYRDYEAGKSVSGHILPQGLRDGSIIPRGPIWTPSTKEQIGHDVPTDYRDDDKKYPGLQRRTLQLFKIGWQHADEVGLLLLDFKGEAGHLSNGTFVWCDELFTTDSCRFVWKADYQREFVEEGHLPASKDKEILRKAGRALGIHLLNPKSHADRETAKLIRFPLSVIAEVQKAADEIFTAWAGMPLLQFQQQVMGIVA